ncbi:M24 family metallopeptidase [Carboxydothermus hydrogenoformans]|uniref:Putative proline dipeptidase n=1 Tax=Carboxydothermus hydrogenoformans (strain ATCC BAA-161 / DSM 6008 / Z-2901) TaxID=246194 RepID=Q3ACH2_CARHZ|nr:Xaa-Pro peptidase family protein [Carboxydothermus hydrogenoformans]ABB15212.1 putative proline dipeptidase [Carboxydothermus hydrogenoformans Z-2901]
MAAKFIYRIKKVQRLMTERKIDILVVVKRENIIYLTGLTQIENMAVLIPIEGEPCIIANWLDADYIEEESGLKTFSYFKPRENLGDKIAKRINAYGFRNVIIGLEKYFISNTVFETIKKALPEAKFIDASDLFYKVRAIKEPSEVEKIKQAAVMVCKGMETALNLIRPGVSMLELSKEVEYALLKMNSNRIPFRIQIVSGERGLLNYAASSCKYIKDGNIVLVFLEAIYEGYYAKICRTIAVGKIPLEQELLFENLLEAQEKAIAALRPGAKAWEVDFTARRIFKKLGLENQFMDIIGYGVGLRPIEYFPIIGRKYHDLIEAGMVIELFSPKIYVKDRGGPRITDLIYVGEHENEILTAFPRKLFRV